MTNRTRTAVVALAGTLVAFGMLSACAPQPEPEPEPTAVFASEEEAFAAAEETYRGFTEALNMERDGDSGADPKSFLIGKALEDEIASGRDFQAAGLTAVGVATVASFSGIEVTGEGTGAKVVAEACVDVTATSVRDASGADVTPSGREQVVDVRIVFVEAGGVLLIEDVAPGGFRC